MFSKLSLPGFCALAVVGAAALTGCTDPEITYEQGAPATASNEQLTPVQALANEPGHGTAVAFPDTAQPSYEAPTPGADRYKVYGTRFYRTSGSNNPIRSNISLPDNTPLEEESKEAPAETPGGSNE